MEYFATVVDTAFKAHGIEGYHFGIYSPSTGEALAITGKADSESDDRRAESFDHATRLSILWNLALGISTEDLAKYQLALKETKSKSTQQLGQVLRAAQLAGFPLFAPLDGNGDLLPVQIGTLPQDQIGEAIFKFCDIMEGWNRGR